MSSREFHIGDILTITTGRMVAPTGIGAVYAILNYMTGDDLYTHQLPRVMTECRPWLLRQHPALTDVDASGVTADNWLGWLDEQAARFGQSLPVAPIPPDDHAQRDPVSELVEMTGPGKVITVTPKEADR